jgi:uncharacterized membrane protein
VSTLTEMTRSALDAAAKQKPAKKNGVLSDPKKLVSDPKKVGAAGIAIATLPVAIEQIAKRVAPKVSDVGEQAKQKLSDAASGLGDAGDKVSSLGEGTKDVVSKLKPEGSSGGGLLSKLTPGSSDEDDEEGRAAPGYGGGGRRMPIQQSIDVAVPIKIAYNRWTQFEDWPEFMHRVESVEQVDDTTVSITTKAWGITRRFEAEIVEQRPDRRIEWNATGGIAHTGVVTFHKLAERLTHIEVSMDVAPQGLMNKFARGTRFTKRAVRADLHRFKALVELDEEAEGGWRGTIEDGKVKRRTERPSSSSNKRRRTQSRNGSGPSSKKNRSRSTS